MTTFGQSGIDILCDAAAGSATSPSSRTPKPTPATIYPDRSSSTKLVPTASPAPPSAPQVDASIAFPSRQSKQPKRKHPSSPRSAQPSHVCHICNRVYERADHLTRHLRAHENARPYQCTRCPKRFNRADLLTRHEATHDRDGAESGRSSIRRSDRASEACTHCAASKAKCEDEKPCARCRSRNLHCEMPAKRFHQLRTPNSYATAVSTPESPPSVTAGQQDFAPGPASQASQYDAEMDGATFGTSPYANSPAPHAVLHAAPYPRQSPAPTTSLHNQPQHEQQERQQQQQQQQQRQQQHQPQQPPGAPDGSTLFNPSGNSFPNVDFSSWDLNFDNFPVPLFEPFGPSPSTGSTHSKTSAKAVMRDPARGHEAFKRSPWLWEPGTEDYLRRETEGLNVIDDLTRGLRIERVSKELYPHIRIDAGMRDKLFAMVLSQNKNGDKIPSFPSVGLLNYILLVHFTLEDRKFDSWVHIGSFSPSTSLPIFIAALATHGAMYVSSPVFWQLGMAMHEVVRLAIGYHVRNDTRCLAKANRED